MDTSSMGRGDQIAAVGGVLLIISLFLTWADPFSGWEINNTFDVFLLITAVVALAAAFVAGDFPLPGVSMSGAAALLGAVATILVLWLLVFDWPEGADRGIGIFLALIGAAAVAYGGFESSDGSRRV